MLSMQQWEAYVETKTIRMNLALIQRAEEVSAGAFRKPSKQIEYWASIGQQVENDITAQELSEVLQGKAIFEIKPKSVDDFSIDSLDEDIESLRRSGTLKKVLISGDVWYEPSEVEGHLAKKNFNNNEEVIGQFVDGQFVPKKD